MKKPIIIMVSVLLCLSILFGVFIALNAGKIKSIEPYRDEFIALIEGSFEVNEIFFGSGLPVYERGGGLGETYHSEAIDEAYLAYFKETIGKDYPESFYEEYSGKIRLYYWIYEDPNLTSLVEKSVNVCKYRTQYYVDSGETDDNGNAKYKMKFDTTYAVISTTQGVLPSDKINFGEKIFENEEGHAYYLLKDYEEPVYEYLYSENDNKYYDVVRADSKYQSIESMKILAEKYYSMDYLNSIYSALFDGIRSDFNSSGEHSSILPARYILESNEDGMQYLKKSNQIKPRFEGQREYDYSTMKIKAPYGRNSVNVTIEAFGSFYSKEHNATLVGIHEVELTFVRENGVWKLDTPTY